MKFPIMRIHRMRKVPVIDATGLHALDELVIKCRRQGTVLLLSGVQANVVGKLKKIGLWEEIGEQNVLGNIEEALDRARILMEKVGA